MRCEDAEYFVISSLIVNFTICISVSKKISIEPYLVVRWWRANKQERVLQSHKRICPIPSPVGVVVKLRNVTIHKSYTCNFIILYVLNVHMVALLHLSLHCISI